MTLNKRLLIVSLLKSQTMHCKEWKVLKMAWLL